MDSALMSFRTSRGFCFAVALVTILKKSPDFTREIPFTSKIDSKTFNTSLIGIFFEECMVIFALNPGLMMKFAPVIELTVLITSANSASSKLRITKFSEPCLDKKAFACSGVILGGSFEGIGVG